MAEELTFRLEDFEGPLELLLTLVQKHKMDLHNIPILELVIRNSAFQYMTHRHTRYIVCQHRRRNDV